MQQLLEKNFKKRVMRELKAIDGLYCFIKEAVALRGIPDIIGVYRGRFFAFELKKSEKSAQEKTGRIVLQKVIINKINKAGGYACIAYPENWNEVLNTLKEFK